MKKETKEKINQLWRRWTDTNDENEEHKIAIDLHILLLNSNDVTPTEHRIFIMGAKQ